MILELVKVTVFIISFISVVLFIGRKIIRLFGEIEESSWFTNAIAYLTGLAVFIYGLLLLGLLGQFRFWPLCIYLSFLVIISMFEVKAFSAFVSGNITNWFKIPISQNIWLVFFLILLVLLNYITCFAPPVAWDEVAYHIPEAKSILAQGKIAFPVGGHLLYGNLPVSMEVLYAFAILFSGYSLIHVLHYSMFLAAVVLIYSFLKTRYTSTVGLVGAIFIFLISGFVDNATSGYIDAATTVYEITGLLLLIGWLEKEKDNYLYLAGLFLGLGLNVKYSTLYNLIGYLLVVGLFVILRHKYSVSDILKKSLKFSLFVLIGGGFWYIKNLVIYGNPIYPFLFGHPGFSATELEGISRAIKGFIFPRDFINFIKIPYIFFLARGASLKDVFVFITFILVPFSLLNKKSFRISVILLCIAFINLALWFFVITHQSRFLFSTLVILAVLSAITISGLRLMNLKSLIIILFVLIIGNYFIQIIPGRVIVRSLYADIFKGNELRLFSGNITRADYLANNLGDFIYITDFINNNFSNQTIANFWNHNAYFYLDNGNNYIQDVPIKENEYASFIKDRKIELLAVDLRMRKRFILNPNWNGWKESRIEFEKYFISNSDLIFKSNGNFLFKIHKLVK